MNIACPRCNSLKYHGAGGFLRKSDGKYVPRYRCKSCGKKYSRATFQPCYRQKKRQVNHLVYKLLCSGVSQRRCAKILNINRKTVERKFRFLAMRARDIQKNFLREKQFKKVHLDDLITIHHTKLKPLSISVVAEDKTRTILGARVSIIPSFGLLAKISRKKYGLRPNQHPQELDHLLKNLKPYIPKGATFYSDEHKAYPKCLAENFTQYEHHTHPSIPACVAGQGELKRSHRDPLFSINHTLAMFRANINRLFRRTWCTTKSPARLQDHVDLYTAYHNGLAVS